MPLPAVLGAASSGLSILGGIYNLFQGSAEERRRRRELRRQELLDRADQAAWDRRYGRVQDEMGDFYSGTEGGAGRASRMDSELLVAEPGLRAGSSGMAGEITGARAGMQRSLSRRGITGPAAAAGLAELETGIANAQRTARLGAVERARGERAAWAQGGGQRPVGRAGTMRELYAQNQVQGDLSGIQTGLQELAFLASPNDVPGRQPAGSVVGLDRMTDEELLMELRRRRQGGGWPLT